MRVLKLSLAFSAACLLMSAAPVSAATCTAPGHATCTITCSGGCGAIYAEPNGPCTTFCDTAKAGHAAAASASTSGLTYADLQKLLTKNEKALKQSMKPK